ncbi:MAG TPA: glycosyltransferase family 4 protein [Candidatus Dormibacteraeota bacterium]|nr:glycosyltransferase family 4 protein [Candidatus Dormibacteraeota bacterium]
MRTEHPGPSLDNLTIVSPRYPPYVGGVENHVSQLAKRANRFFRHVTVITTDPLHRYPQAEQNDSLSIFRIRSFAPGENFHFPSLTGLFRLLVESHPQVLHLHSVHDVPGPIAGMMPRSGSMIFTPHFVGRLNSGLGRIFFGAYRPFIREFVEKVPRIICISRFESRLMLETFPESHGKIEIIPNGVDSDLRERNQWKEPNDPSVLYAGRLEKYKNVDLLMKAVSGLRSKHDRLRLRIVGKGPHREELTRLCHSLAMDDCVDWYDRLPQSELFPLYASSSAVVLASEHENWGNVVAEAIAVGTPTIVANSSSLAEFVEEGLAQPVEPPVDEKRLASVIDQVLDNPKKYSPRGIKSRLIISWDEVATKTFEPCLSMAN